MKVSKWIRCYDTKNDSLLQEWRICKAVEIPKYWVDCFPIEHPVACMLTGQKLAKQGREYFLEMGE
jgi:hypothetical protein